MPRTMPAPNQTSKPPRQISGVAPPVFRKTLLAWYDRHARVLPWRYVSGKKADPYYVWLSEVMLQQTTVQAVIPYFVKFVDKWPDIAALAAAPDDDVMRAWAGLGYYARARNLLKCARVVANEHGGVFPSTLEELKALPGIGDYTAAAVASIAFDKPATVVDGNVERVVSRYYALEDPLPAVKPGIRDRAALLFEGRVNRAGDFAQAMMDLGATVCTPKSPKCSICPVAGGCAARVQGIAETLPRRGPQKTRPRRFGYVFWITDARGRVLFEKRPDKGLLGGMTGLPTTEWADKKIGHIPDMKYLQTESMLKKYKIRHVFTHFELELAGVSGTPARGFMPGPGQFWVEASDVDELGLPTVFKKFVRLMNG